MRSAFSCTTGIVGLCMCACLLQARKSKDSSNCLKSITSGQGITYCRIYLSIFCSSHYSYFPHQIYMITLGAASADGARTSCPIATHTLHPTPPPPPPESFCSASSTRVLKNAHNFSFFFHSATK